MVKQKIQILLEKLLQMIQCSPGASIPPQLRPCMVSILLAHRKIWNLRSDYTRAQAMREKGITRITNLLLLTPEENYSLYCWREITYITNLPLQTIDILILTDEFISEEQNEIQSKKIAKYKTKQKIIQVFEDFPKGGSRIIPQCSQYQKVSTLT